VPAPAKELAMTPSRTAARFFAWFVALWLAAGPAQAGPNRPFKGSFDVEERIGRLTSCPGVDGQPGPGATFTGTGHATHLGQVELNSQHCITIKLDQPDKQVYVSNGHMRLTAPNGDWLLADYAGFFTRVSDDVFSFEGNYYITGGTGRFAEASGTGALFGTAQGSFTTVSQTLRLSADGHIRY
jgi:hypothetical protein